MNSKPTATPEHLTRLEAMNYLRCGSTKLWELEKERLLVPVRFGRKLLYPRRDLERFMERLAKKAARSVR